MIQYPGTSRILQYRYVVAPVQSDIHSIHRWFEMVVAALVVPDWDNTGGELLRTKLARVCGLGSPGSGTRRRHTAPSPLWMRDGERLVAS